MYVVAIATDTVVPGAADGGVRDVICGGGLIVNPAVLLLANVTAVVVLPAIDTRYGTGDVIERLLGTTNVTRRVVPTSVAMLTGVPETVGPAPAVAGWKVTTTSDGTMVPDGKFEPVTDTVVMPGCAAAGEADDASVMLDCARTAIDPPSARIASTAPHTPRRTEVVSITRGNLYR